MRLTSFALFVLAAFAARAETVLFDFETEEERKAIPLKAEGGYEVSVTNAFAPSGEWALRLWHEPLKKGNAEWPSVTLKSPVADWRDYDRLVVELYTDRDAPEGRLYVYVSSSGKDFWAKKGFHPCIFLPRHGYTQWVVPLGKWPQETDAANIATLQFHTAAWCQRGEMTFLIDRVSLLKKGEPLPKPQGPCWARDLLPAVRKELADMESTNLLLKAAAAHAPDYARLRHESDASSFKSSAMALGWATSMEKVMPRDAFPSQPIPDNGLSLRLARNEYESFQLLVAPKDADLKGVKVAVDGDLTPVESSELELKVGVGVQSGGGESTKLSTFQPFNLSTTFAATNVAANVMGYVKTTKTAPYKVGYNVPTNAVPGYTRLTRNPERGWWPDPILNFLDGVDIAGTDVQSFWIRVRCPEDQPAGEYRGALVVSADGVEPVRIPFAVRVNGFTLGRGSPLPLAVSFAAWPDRGPETPARKWKNHQTEWIDFLADYYITMHHLYSGSSTAVIKRLNAQGRLGMYNLRYWTPPVSTNEADMARWREKTIPSVTNAYATMKSLGLLDHAYLYGCDESRKEKFPAIRAAVQELKAAAPGVPISTTAFDDEFGVGTPLDVIDWFTPMTSKFDPEKVASSRKVGHKVWWYICMSPKAPYANMFIECPAIEGRILMGAQTTRMRPDGFLYYAISLWHQTHCIESGPFTDWNPRSFESYHGDGSWVCAGPDGTPLPTIRLENFRDGLEDYAYAKLLEQKLKELGEDCSQMTTNANCSQIANTNKNLPSSNTPSLPEAEATAPLQPSNGQTVQPSNRASWAQRAREALAVPREVMDSMTNYTDDPAVLYRWRDEMADLIEDARQSPRNP